MKLSGGARKQLSEGEAYSAGAVHMGSGTPERAFTYGQATLVYLHFPLARLLNSFSLAHFEKKIKFKNLIFFLTSGIFSPLSLEICEVITLGLKHLFFKNLFCISHGRWGGKTSTSSAGWSAPGASRQLGIPVSHISCSTKAQGHHVCLCFKK